MSRLPWWEPHEDEEWYCKQVSHLSSIYGGHERLEYYATVTAAAAAVCADLGVEGTQPRMPSDKLLGELQGLFAGSTTDAGTGSLQPAGTASLHQQPPGICCLREEQVTWESDGGSATLQQQRRQLAQHVRAYQYLWSLPANQPLTLEVVKEAHGILMRGAVTEDGQSGFAGVFRQSAAHARAAGGGYQAFERPDDIEARLASVLDQLDSPDLLSIAKFLERFLNVHPFVDGNGRLVRMLVARCLRIYGLPIPAALAGGRNCKSGRQHYLQALLRARQGRGQQPHDHLRLLLLESAYQAWKGFHDYISGLQHGV